MVLQEEQVLLESQDLHLQRHMSDTGVINDLLELTEATLHRLTYGQLCLTLDSEVISSKMDTVNLQDDENIN